MAIINFAHLKRRVIEHLEKIHNQIDQNADQKHIIMSKARKILDEFISRAKNDEFTIRKDTKLTTIASAIIYSVIISNESMPNINLTEISKISKVNNGTISSYYNNHFYHLYPKIKFSLGFSHKLKKIRNKIALLFFEKTNDSEVEISKKSLVSKENILNNITLSNQLKDSDIKILQKMAELFPNEFAKYFSDLARIIDLLVIICSNLKKISAHFQIKPFSDFLQEQNINLYYSSSMLPRVITEIFDFLQKNYPESFPVRTRMSKGISGKKSVRQREEYRIIIGHKLKIFIIRHIYNGHYFINGQCQCLKCFEEGFSKNTNELRSTSLEFHHDSDSKESEYSAYKLSRIFENNAFNPYFLDELIHLLESEKVEVLCRNHHHLKHSIYFNHFKTLINWDNVPAKFPQDIFTLPPEFILLLIKITVDNFPLTKNLSRDKKYYIRYSIERYLKKRYIIERFHRELCDTCGEINVKRYLPSFAFHHNSNAKFHINPYIHSKINSPSKLFIQSYSCSKIAQILEYEEGGFVCSNCHNVLEYTPTYLKLLSNIYEDKITFQKVIDDYTMVKKKFRLYRNTSPSEDPLKIDSQITDTYEKYLEAIYNLSINVKDVSISTLANYFNRSRATVLEILTKKESFFKNFVDLKIGRNRLKKYILTDQGKLFIELISYFRDYYSKL